MIVGESIANPSSLRMPCNHTHHADVFTAPMYLDLVDERGIVCYLLLEQPMVPCVIMNT